MFTALRKTFRSCANFRETLRTATVSTYVVGVYSPQEDIPERANFRETLRAATVRESVVQAQRAFLVPASPVREPGSTYSSRNASDGEIKLARNAGISAATNADNPSAAIAAAVTPAWNGFIP